MEFLIASQHFQVGGVYTKTHIPNLLLKNEDLTVENLQENLHITVCID